MISYRQAPLPSDVGRDVRGFVGSVLQIYLHNKLVDGLQSAREKLEKTTTWDETLRQQGVVQAHLAMLALLHENDTDAVKKELYV